MQKAKTSVLVIAVVTGLILICFQLYWLNNTFETYRRNFVKTASNDLQQSVNSYMLEQNGHMLKLQFPDSSMSVSVSDSLPGSKGSFKWKRYKAGLSPGNLQSFEVIMSGMLSQVANNPIATARIREIYQSQLKTDGIDLGFQFIVFPDSSRTYPGSVRAQLGITSNSPLLVAEFEKKGAFFLKQNLPNVAVSLCLILLIIGCLWYLNHVILQQARLHRLQTRFIDNMAHEFRTPLAILISTHEALNEFGELADHEKALKYIQANQSVLRKLDSHLDRILKMAPVKSRQKMPVMEKIDLYALLQEITAQYSYHKKAVVTIVYELDSPEVLCDRFYLETILSNVVDNAFKYATDSPEIAIRVSPFRDGWQIEIGDNGPGIPQRDLPYIFDKFYRVSSGDVHDTKGYGLGLSYVRELMTILHGRVTVKSVVSKGSIFTLQFPTA